MISSVTGKRQLTIPAKIARELSIDEGSKVEWISGVKAGEVTLRVRPTRVQLLDRLRELGNKYKGKGVDSCVFLEQERERDEELRMGSLCVAEGKAEYRVRLKRKKK